MSNRTGMATSPLDGRALIEGTSSSQPMQPMQPDPRRSMETANATRAWYHQQDDMALGTVPMPSTVKGIAAAVVQKLGGKRPETFIDKLGERLAFERSGVRLYDAILEKCRATAESSAGLEISKLEHFRNEELQHFVLVRDAIESLGADPTAMTPAADVMAVASKGFAHVVGDPRTTVEQGLEAILLAELADNDGWETLISLAKELGMNEMAQAFSQALGVEREHLEQVRAWLRQAVAARAQAA